MRLRATLVIALLPAHVATACSCDNYWLESSYEHAEVVLAGCVTRIVPRSDVATVEFQVFDAWKGVRGESFALDLIVLKT